MFPRSRASLLCAFLAVAAICPVACSAGGSGTARPPRSAHAAERSRDRGSRAAALVQRTQPVPNATESPSGAQGITSPRLRITFLAIGQGDSALLESDDGHAALIDSGPPEGSTHLSEVLAAHHVARLDWLMHSHPHLDHIGGAGAILGRIAVDRVIDPAFPHPLVTYERLLARINEIAIPFQRALTGGRLTIGAHVAVEILLPHDPFIQGTRSDVNSNSIVARVTTGTVSVLFTGDAERETEERLLHEGASHLASDVLKIAHHGSRFASTPEFLTAVTPHYAVISCATGNDYGHPHAATLESLSQRGIAFYRTDLEGDVSMQTDGTVVRFDTERSAETAAMLVPGQRESHAAPAHE